ncbi:MAG: class I SAM-dependent methyltransferase [Gammaproteobacteria bacterium]|nr:class I SAM-dependent methyltransferase [Gammaproteobacteria bacterium]
MKLLIFPFEMDTAKEMAIFAQELGINVLRGSSDPDFNSKKDDVLALPYISESDFSEHLEQIIDQQEITHIFSPHVGVWTKLAELLNNEPSRFEFKLSKNFPFEFNAIRYQSSIFNNGSTETKPDIEHLDCFQTFQPKARLTHFQKSALIHLFESIPGQCDRAKLDGLCDIFRVAPAGDIVEIGVLYGRSACTMAWLADKYNIGSVVAIDPWCQSGIDDQGEAANILNRLAFQVDFEKIYKIFLTNAALFSNLSYLKETSTTAVPIYEHASQKGYLKALELPQIDVKGKIAVLHIDGNHRYDMVKNDIEQWLPFVLPGGWVLLDDYCWKFGDGPKELGDQLIMETSLFDCSFCLGDTLYLRRSDSLMS